MKALHVVFTVVIAIFSSSCKQSGFVASFSTATARSSYKTQSQFPLIIPANANINDNGQQTTASYTNNVDDDDDDHDQTVVRLFGSAQNRDIFRRYYWGTKNPIHVRRSEDGSQLMDPPPLPSRLHDFFDTNRHHMTLRSNTPDGVGVGQPMPISTDMTWEDFQTLIHGKEVSCSAVIPVTHDPRLETFRTALEQWFEKSVVMTIYHSGPNASALPPHTDSYDVLVLQLEGCKDWEIVQGFAATRTVTQLTLQPGDLLFIPYNVIHSARTTEGFDYSTHLTIGLLNKWKPSNTIEYSQYINNNNNK